MINIQHLSKKFKKFTAVDDISLTVNKGEIFAFLGPNGAGKSTTIKMLTTLLEPSSGNFSLAGHENRDGTKALRANFGIVFQDSSLDDDLTAYENMHFHAVLFQVPTKERKEKINRMLDFVELSDRKNELVKKFSGGMKRRLEIARGLLHAPPIMFLDEPTLGLDAQTRNHLWDYLKNLNAKNQTTIFFTTHYLEEAEKIANRIAIIDHGKIIACGTTEELKKQTQTNSLEEAYLALTGKDLRDEEVGSAEQFKQRHRAMHR